MIEDFLEVGQVLLRDGGEAFHEVANTIFHERFLARLKMSEVSLLEWLGPAGQVSTHCRYDQFQCLSTVGRPLRCSGTLWALKCPGPSWHPPANYKGL